MAFLIDWTFFLMFPAIISDTWDSFPRECHASLYTYSCVCSILSCLTMWADFSTFRGQVSGTHFFLHVAEQMENICSYYCRSTDWTEEEEARCRWICNNKHNLCSDLKYTWAKCEPISLTREAIIAARWANLEKKKKSQHGNIENK